jgi:hypothetical protein
LLEPFGLEKGWGRSMDTWLLKKGRGDCSLQSIILFPWSIIKRVL